MSKITQKFFADSDNAATKLFNDVGNNNVRYYEVDEYRSVAVVSIHPPPVLDKFSQVVVATSGDTNANKDWMIVAPYRVDADKGTNAKKIDIDPVLLVLDANTGSSHPSGVVAYHQPFSGRTTQVPGYEKISFENTVSDLRAKVTAGLQPLEEAPPQVLTALQHMVDRFRTDLT